MDKNKENSQKNTIKIIVYCYPGDVDGKEKARSLLKYADITEIDLPDNPPPNKKISCFSFMAEMDKAPYIINALNAQFSAKSPFIDVTPTKC